VHSSYEPKHCCVPAAPQLLSLKRVYSTAANAKWAGEEPIKEGNNGEEAQGSTSACDFIHQNYTFANWASFGSINRAFGFRSRAFCRVHLSGAARLTGGRACCIA
jgi:hypothetical protein